MEILVKIYKPDRGKRQSTLARFETWAATNKVELLKIPEESGRKTPDYKAIFPDTDRTEVIVEAKEIDTPFTVDSEATITLQPKTGRSEEMKFWGDAVRRKIKKAHPQLAPYARDGHPTLLLIGMWTPAIDRVLNFAIPFAMRGGKPQIGVQGGALPFVLEGIASGGKQLADDTNTSISGIGRVVKESHVSPWRLVVYRHNNPMIALPEALPGVDYFD